MSDTVPAPAAKDAVSPASFLARVDWAAVAKGAAMLAVGVAIFWMEMSGHADKGTFLNYVALPVMGFMGLHTAATRMQGVQANA